MTLYCIRSSLEQSYERLILSRKYPKTFRDEDRNRNLYFSSICVNALLSWLLMQLQVLSLSSTLQWCNEYALTKCIPMRIRTDVFRPYIYESIIRLLISNCNLTGEPSGKNIYLYYIKVVISFTRWEIVSVWITFYISGYFRNHNLSQSKLFPLVTWPGQLLISSTVVAKKMSLM